MENPLQVGEPLSLVTICLDGYGLGQLRNSIASLPMVHLRAEFQHYLAQNDDQILLERADIYVIDFDQNREEAVHTAERIHEVLGRTAIFALSSNSDPLLIIRAMQCGCTEYLLKPVDRDELLKVLYKGRARPMYVHGFYPDLPGWDPTWEKRFPEMYGYDVQAAKRLLAEAGYPKGFKAKAWLFPFAGAPELIPLMEAIQAEASLSLLRPRRECPPAGRRPPAAFSCPTSEWFGRLTVPGRV